MKAEFGLFPQNHELNSSQIVQPSNAMSKRRVTVTEEGTGIK